MHSLVGSLVVPVVSVVPVVVPVLEVDEEEPVVRPQDAISISWPFWTTAKNTTQTKKNKPIQYVLSLLGVIDTNNIPIQRRIITKIAVRSCF